jgi:hypothetical protein
MGGADRREERVDVEGGEATFVGCWNSIESGGAVRTLRSVLAKYFSMLEI